MNGPTPEARRARLLEQVALALLVLGAIGWASYERFTCDDAFISFHYARSLVRGTGLTWFGERVEGYTNFLWVLWVALGLKIGAPPIAWSHGGSLAALGASLLLTYRVALARGATGVVALSAVAVLATNATYLSFGTSGLETMLQSALVCAAWLAAETAMASMSIAALATLSVLGALALMTRLDSAVLLVPLFAAPIVKMVRDGERRPAPGAALLLPGPLLVLAWLVWKLAYYGDVLPNTFHAKTAMSAATLTNGARFVGEFFRWYGLWPWLLSGLALAAWRRTLGRVWVPLVAVFAWVSYVVAVGGDFMEFRFFVPVLPLLSVLLVETVATEAERLPRPALRAPLVPLAVLSLSAVRGAPFPGTADATIDPIKGLATFYGKVPDGDWERLARPLRAVLSGSGATLACNGAGAIPYYSELPTIDQLGLTDEWVAQNGVRPGFARPGHQRFAPLSYLRKRGVSLVVGTPTILPRGALRSRQAAFLASTWPLVALGPAAERVPSLTLVEAPLDEKESLILWYLTPTPEVTARIEKAGWTVTTIEGAVP